MEEEFEELTSQEKQEFDQWYKDYVNICKKNGCKWLAAGQENYEGNFREQISPDETFILEVSYAQD